MSRKPGNYQYQKITTTTRTISLPNQNKYSEERKTITTTNSLGGQRAKVDLNTLNKSENVQFFKCNKCGKLKYNINKTKTSLESGSWSKRNEITEINRKTKSLEKYGIISKSNSKCTCGKDHSNCICGKGEHSVTKIATRRSDNVKGQIDLTPKLTISLTPEKIKKAVEEQRRIAEEDKKRRANRTINTEETPENILTKKDIPTKKRLKETSKWRIYVIAVMKIVE